ncbi:hypothetical protein HKD37_08G020799 [Glycine soja]
MKRKKRLGILAPQPARQEHRRRRHPRPLQKHQTRYRLALPRQAPQVVVPYLTLDSDNEKNLLRRKNSDFIPL